MTEKTGLNRKEYLFSYLAASLCITEAPALAADEQKTDELGEITVTAQRRSQTTQDIPYNITAIAGSSLENASALGPNDLGRVVPGLITIDAGPATRGGASNFTLRGLRTDSPDGGDGSPQNVSSVSTYFGDTAVFFPVVLKDIERIEVLRGPQGTLYGNGAEGGTIRIIPKRPEFTAFSGDVTVGGGITEHSSGQTNENFDGAFNIPITDNLAVRVVGGIEHLGGFINDVNILERTGSGTHAGVALSDPADQASAPIIGPVQKGTNTSDQDFFRASLRYKPVEKVDLQLDYVYQDTKVADLQASNPHYTGGTIDFANGAAVPPTNSAYTANGGGTYVNTLPIRSPYQNKINLVSATATVDFGLASFTSVSSYYQNTTNAVGDTSSYYGSHDGVTPGYITYYGNYPRFIAITTDDNKEKTFSQEVRVVSSWDKHWDYVVGAYFQDQKTTNVMNQVAPGISAYGTYSGDPSASPDSGDQVYYIARNGHFQDRAIFGELTGHLTSQWQVTGGLRVFSQSFTSGFVQESPYCGASCGDGITEPTHLGIAVANNTSDVHNHVAKLNTSYDLSDQLKVYATYAEGFRRGGANGIPIAGYFRSITQYETYQPDFAKTYEIGTKGSLFDHRLRFDADLFLINLDNFQFSTSTPSYEGGVFNGSQARSKGGEFELTGDITRHLKASFAYTYTRAAVSKTTTLSDYPIYSIVTGAQPSVFLTLDKGATLPGVPKHTLNAALDYTMPAGDMNVILHGDAAFRSWSLGAIDVNSTGYWRIDPVTTFNGLVTLDSGKSWSAGLSIVNITNAVGYSAGIEPQTYNIPWSARTVMRPRTYGLALHYHF
jgi:iron complex outermembrane recepter protein